MEAAETNAQQLKGELHVGKVANGSTAENAAGEKPCHRCGRRGHKDWECHFKDFICNHCKKKGHLARVCRSRTQTQDTDISQTDWWQRQGAEQTERQMDRDSLNRESLIRRLTAQFSLLHAPPADPSLSRWS